MSNLPHYLREAVVDCAQMIGDGVSLYQAAENYMTRLSPLNRRLLIDEIKTSGIELEREMPISVVPKLSRNFNEIETTFTLATLKHETTFIKALLVEALQASFKVSPRRAPAGQPA